MSGYVKYNPNPKHKRVGDCVIRAIAKATGQSWDKTFVGVCLQGFIDKDMPDANKVWGNYLIRKGFARERLPAYYDEGYDVDDFARENPIGTYILAIAGHVVCVHNGRIFDTWYSGEESPAFIWYKKR